MFVLNISNTTYLLATDLSGCLWLICFLILIHQAGKCTFVFLSPLDLHFFCYRLWTKYLVCKRKPGANRKSSLMYLVLIHKRKYSPTSSWHDWTPGWMYCSFRHYVLYALWKDIFSVTHLWKTTVNSQTINQSSKQPNQKIEFFQWNESLFVAAVHLQPFHTDM